MFKPFEREARYVVLKGTDIAQFLTEQEQHRLKNLMATVAQWRAKSGKAPLDVFVLESDWPEFDIAVDMVRRRMEGLITRDAEYTARLADWQRDYGILKASADAYRSKADAVIRTLKDKLARAEDIQISDGQVAAWAERYDIMRGQSELRDMVEDAASLHLAHGADVACATCGGSGSIGGISGQTPESYSEETYPCPDCVESNVITMGARQPGMQTMRDLAMLVKQLCRAIVDHPTRVTEHGRGLADKAMDYLKRKGLEGLPMRQDEADSAWQERCREFDAHLTPEKESGSWVTEWSAKVPRYNMVAKADGAYPRETADGEYVLWTDHFAKLQELLKDHGDAALQEIDRLLNENAELTADRDKWQGKAHALNQEMIAKAAKLSPMSTAPRDGTEILAYNIDGKSYHPVFSQGDHWGMRWNEEYYCGDGCYSGWIPYPKGGD